MEEPNLTLQMECAKHINSTRKWMKFFGIVMIVMMPCLILAGVGSIVSGSVIGQTNPPLDETIPGVHIIVGVIYIVTAIVYIFPTIYLLRAAKAGKSAVALHDNSKMAEFAKNTKSYWKYTGILAIVALSFMALAMLAGIGSYIAILAAM